MPALETVEIDGFERLVVNDAETLDGELMEDTVDRYARDTSGDGIGDVCSA